MPVRRRAWLTREGWYYLAVVAFVVGGAILRSINLLVVLAGLMIAPLIFNWRLVLASLLGLRVQRRLPAEAVAGQPLTVEIQVENSRGWLSSWLLTFEDCLQRVTAECRPDAQRPGAEGSGMPSVALSRPLGGAAKHRPLAQRLADAWRWLCPRRAAPADDVKQVQTMLAHVPAHGSASAVYRVCLMRRGRYRLGPLRVSTSYPLGLVRGQMTLPLWDELVVLPRIGHLLPAWARLVAGEPAGQQWRHPQRGISDGDYYGLRPWQSGDALRWVHWRTTAKLARPIVRQYERRANTQAVLLLDPWLPPDATPEDDQRLELAISLTATALTDLAARGQVRLCLVIADSSPQVLRVPASTLGCQEILVRLATLPGSEVVLWPALTLAAEALPPGGRLVIVSPRSATHPTLEGQMTDLPLAPDDVLWIDTGSSALDELLVL